MRAADRAIADEIARRPTGPRRQRVSEGPQPKTVLILARSRGEADVERQRRKLVHPWYVIVTRVEHLYGFHRPTDQIEVVAVGDFFSGTRAEEICTELEARHPGLKVPR